MGNPNFRRETPKGSATASTPSRPRPNAKASSQGGHPGKQAATQASTKPLAPGQPDHPFGGPSVDQLNQSLDSIAIGKAIQGIAAGKSGGARSPDQQEDLRSKMGRRERPLIRRAATDAPWPARRRAGWRGPCSAFRSTPAGAPIRPRCGRRPAHEAGHQTSTSSPLRSMTDKSRRAAPLGFFSPVSHFCTVETLALR